MSKNTIPGPRYCGGPHPSTVALAETLIENDISFRISTELSGKDFVHQLVIDDLDVETLGDSTDPHRRLRPIEDPERLVETQLYTGDSIAAVLADEKWSTHRAQLHWFWTFTEADEDSTTMSRTFVVDFYQQLIDEPDELTYLGETLVQAYDNPPEEDPDEDLLPWTFDLKLMFLIHHLAERAAEQIEEEIDEHDGSHKISVTDMHPDMAVRIPPMPKQWWSAFSASFRLLALRIENPASPWGPLPNSTGQEAALHTVLRGAEELLSEHSSIDEVFESLCVTLPLAIQRAPAPDPKRTRPVDVNTLLDIWFEDHDVLLYNDPRMDGFENDAELDNALGYLNIKYGEWFKPFTTE